MLLALLAIGRGLYLGALPGDAVTQAGAAAILDHVVRALAAAGRVVVLLGLGLALAGWLGTGTGGAARWVRRLGRGLAGSRHVWGRPVGTALAVVTILVLVLPVALAPASALATLVVAGGGVTLALTSRPPALV